MIRVPPLIILFLLQFLLIFVGLTIFLFFQYRKIGAIAQGEANRLREDLLSMVIQKDKVSAYEDKVKDLEKKYEHVKNIHEKLNKDINKLLTEANRSTVHEQTIEDIDNVYIVLEEHIGGLRKEKEMFYSNSKSLEEDIKNLSQKLGHSVTIEEYDKLNAQKKGLEAKFDKLEKDLEEKAAEHESLKRKYLWLEKEYNALYSNITNNIPD